MLFGLVTLLGLGLASCHENDPSQRADTPPAPARDFKSQVGETMKTVMLQFKHQGSAPSPDEVRQIFNLRPEEMDKDFGVIATDPSEGIYTVLIDARASGRVEAVLAARPHDPAEGIFANPRIEPFGPPVE